MPTYEAVYHCPVCNLSWETHAEAVTCRNKHQPKKKEWWYCEYCGAGFCDHYGRSGRTLAGYCEQEHRDKDEVEETINRRKKSEYLFNCILGRNDIPTPEMVAWAHSPEPLILFGKKDDDADI